MNRGRLAGAVIVISGTSGSVSHSLTQRFAMEGAQLALIGSNLHALHGIARDVVKDNRKVLVMPCDPSNPSAIEDAAERVASRWGAIDVWVNEGLSSVFCPTGHFTAAQLRMVVGFNHVRFVNGTIAALGHMLARDSGAVIQIGTAFGYRSVPLRNAYRLALSAIGDFSAALRAELARAKSSVKVTVLRPPACPSRFYAPDDVIRAWPGASSAREAEFVAATSVRIARKATRDARTGWCSAMASTARRLVSRLVDGDVPRRDGAAQTREAPQTARKWLRSSSRSELDFDDVRTTAGWLAIGTVGSGLRIDRLCANAPDDVSVAADGQIDHRRADIIKRQAIDAL